MKKTIQALFTVLLLLGANIVSFAQQDVITGKVIGADDQLGIPGVAILVKGTSTFALTKADGTYSIKAAEGQVLDFSFTGYTAKEVTVGISNVINVELVPDATLLDEAVAVGYGTQKKESLTASVASIDTKVLEARPIPDVGRGLQGVTPGLSIMIPSGEVGSDPVIRIRGQVGSTLKTSGTEKLADASSPLILLDNVEIPSIQMVNPDDIESISILKDASSASIYGAKAAFGVILITSKKGAKTESVNVSYSGSLSFQNIAKKMEMGRLEAMEYSLLAMKRVKSTYVGAFWMVTEEGYEKAKAWQNNYGGAVGKNDPMVYGRDWYVNDNGQKIGLRTYDPYDYMIREWAPTHNHSLSVNGRSGSTAYTIGVGYLDQSGMVKPAKEDGFKRYNGRARVSTDINKWLTVYAGAMYTRSVKRYPYVTNSTTADPWLYLYRWASTYPMTTEDGDPIRNPAYEFGAANTSYRETTYASLNGGLTITPLKDWKINLDYTYADQNFTAKQPGTSFTARNSWDVPKEVKDESGRNIYVNDNGDVVPEGTSGATKLHKLDMQNYTAVGTNPDHVRQESQRDKRATVTLNTTYDWDINDDHGIKAMLGLNSVSYKYTTHWSQKVGLVDYSNPQFDLASGTETAGGGENWESQVGFFGRVNYSFRDKYLVEGNLRYDGTSKFPSDLQWRWFPSFSAGWRVTEEPWMEWSRSFMNSLKFRGSWGKIGDQTVVNSLYIPTMKGSSSNWLMGNSKLFQFSTPGAISVLGVTWQDLITLDLGVDARFLKGALGVTFDWFRRDTKNMIVPLEGIPATFGTTAPRSNFGSIKTTGVELQIDYAHRFENGIGINFVGTFADNKTVVTKYGTTKSIDDYYVGKAIGEIWGYETDRLYQKNDFEYNAVGELIPIKIANDKYTINKLSDPNAPTQGYIQSGNFVFGPGDVKFKDLNNDGVIDEGSRNIDNHGDLKVIGNSTPRYEYSFRVGGDYKGIDLSIFMQGVGKREIWGEGSLAIPGYNSADGAIPEAFASDFWREDRTGAFYPAPYNMAGSSTTLNFVRQSRYLLDMSYFRIKNITLGYTLPASLLSKVNIKKLRVYVALENFFTFHHLGDLPIDPEAMTGYSMWDDDNYNSKRTGVGVPAYKSVSVGLQLNF